MGTNCNFFEKNTQVHLIIIKEWPKNNLFILRNLDYLQPGAFCSPSSLPSTIRHERVMGLVNL